jgi:hypothetical protein
MTEIFFMGPNSFRYTLDKNNDFYNERDKYFWKKISGKPLEGYYTFTLTDRDSI